MKTVILIFIALAFLHTDLAGQTKIIFSRSKGPLNSGGTLDLMIYEPLESTMKLWKKGSVKGRGEYNASTSSQGSKVLFTTYRFGGWKLGIGNVKNGGIDNIRRFIKGSHYQYNAHFSPDGLKVAYQDFDWGSRKATISIADKNGAHQKDFVEVSNSDQSFNWTSDGKHIVYISAYNDFYNIFIKEVEGGEALNLIQKEEHAFAVSTSKTKNRIAYLSIIKGRLSLFTMNTDGSDVLDITPNLNADKFLPEGFWAYRTSWSPDDMQIVFNVMKDGNHEIFTVNSNGTNLKRITRNNDTDITPYWSN